jgi:hypothetical protein
MRNVAKWSWQVVRPQDNLPPAWEVLLRLSAIFMGMRGRSTGEVDDHIFRHVAADVANNCAWPEPNLGEILAKLNVSKGPERTIDMLLRLGPYGDGFGRRPEGLTLKRFSIRHTGSTLVCFGHGFVR